MPDLGGLNLGPSAGGITAVVIGGKALVSATLYDDFCVRRASI
jgi:hypothetical protein